LTNFLSAKFTHSSPRSFQLFISLPAHVFQESRKEVWSTGKLFLVQNRLIPFSEDRRSGLTKRQSYHPGQAAGSRLKYGLMPIYEFACRKCRHRFEALVRIGGEKEVVCPECGSAEVKKLYSTFGIGGVSHRSSASSASAGASSSGSSACASCSSKSCSTCR